MGKKTREIIFWPGKSSKYTGILYGICYIDGNVVSEKKYREYCIEAALKKQGESKEWKRS